MSADDLEKVESTIALIDKILSLYERAKQAGMFDRIEKILDGVLAKIEAKI